MLRLLRARWHYLDPVQHIVLFDRENLSGLLRDAGFDVLGARTFGHHYRIGYVLDRLAYLHADGVLGKVTKAARVVGRPAASRAIYLNIGDVMGIVAKKRAAS